MKDTRNLKSRLIHQAPHGITGLAFKEMAKVIDDQKSIGISVSIRHFNEISNVFLIINNF